MPSIRLRATVGHGGNLNYRSELKKNSPELRAPEMARRNMMQQ